MACPAPFFMVRKNLFKILGFAIALLAGCSGSSTIGVSKCVDVNSLYGAKWPSKNINISVDNIEWRNAGAIWKGAGLTFNYGKLGQIRFAGFAYNNDHCAYSEWKTHNGQMQYCNIYLNPLMYNDLNKCGALYNTLAHEIGHCIGILGHPKVNYGDIMNKHGGWVLNPQTNEAVIDLYNREICN
jgi:hypothetical protein